MRSRYSLVISLAVCPRGLLAWYCLVEAAPISLPLAVIKGVGFRFEQEDCRGMRKASLPEIESCISTTLRRKDRYVTVRRFRGLESQ